MPVDLYDSQHGIFVELETTPGIYVTPGSTAFIQTHKLKLDPNQADKKSIDLDGLSRAVKKTFPTKNHHKLGFSVALSWPSVAPTTAAGLLVVHPLLLSSGAATPVVITSPTTGLQYTESNDAAQVKTVSISYRRRRSSTRHYERKIVDGRGVCKFVWRIGDIPCFEFDYVGGKGVLEASLPLSGDPRTHLANIARPSNATNTAFVLIGGRSVCLTEMTIDNVWRMKTLVTEALCGIGTKHESVGDASVFITVRHPDIETEFNPDALLGNDYSFTATIAGDGLLSDRKLVFNWESLTVEEVKEVMVNNLVHTQLKLSQNSSLILQQF